MLKQMTAMVLENDICVLATAGGSRPHCSLMAYVPDETGERLFMATSGGSRKFENLRKNPHVSLLIDTRTKDPREKTRALTVSGTCKTVDDRNESKAAAARLKSAHPHVAGLLADPDVKILCVKAASFLLLHGVSEAHFLELVSSEE